MSAYTPFVSRICVKACCTCCTQFSSNTAYEERCLTCELPTYVELEVTYTEPAVKGDTASTNALKACTLETGAEIMVPLFINQGDKIRVNTVDRSYGERVR